MEETLVEHEGRIGELQARLEGTAAQLAAHAASEQQMQAQMQAEVDALLAAALGKLSASAAAADVARATGLKRADLYKRALAMKS